MVLQNVFSMHRPSMDTVPMGNNITPKSGMMSNAFVKTKMCPRLKGSNGCRRSNDCLFAHSINELRPLPDLKKTKLCSNYAESRKCLAGSACPFAHGKEELRNNPTHNSVDYFDNCRREQSSTYPDYPINKSGPISNVEQLSDIEMMQRLQKFASDYLARQAATVQYTMGRDFRKPVQPRDVASMEYTTSNEGSTPIVKYKKSRRGKRGGKNRKSRAAEPSASNAGTFQSPQDTGINVLMKMVLQMCAENPSQPAPFLEMPYDGIDDGKWNPLGGYGMGASCDEQGYYPLEVGPGGLDEELLVKEGGINPTCALSLNEIDGMLSTSATDTLPLFNSLKTMMSHRGGFPTEATMFSSISGGDHFDWEVEDSTHNTELSPLAGNCTVEDFVDRQGEVEMVFDPSQMLESIQNLQYHFR